MANLSLCWLTGTIGSQFRLYLEGRARPVHLASDQQVLPPLGVAQFPVALPMPPGRALLRRATLDDEASWQFAVMEQPQALAEEIRSFFRLLRQARSTSP